MMSIYEVFQAHTFVRSLRDEAAVRNEDGGLGPTERGVLGIPQYPLPLSMVKNLQLRTTQILLATAGSLPVSPRELARAGYRSYLPCSSRYDVVCSCLMTSLQLLEWAPSSWSHEQRRSQLSHDRGHASTQWMIPTTGHAEISFPREPTPTSSTPRTLQHGRRILECYSLH